MAVSTRPNVFLRRPVLSVVISILITLVGALALLALPIAQYPDLVPPTVSVTASYPGPGRDQRLHWEPTSTVWKTCSA